MIKYYLCLQINLRIKNISGVEDRLTMLSIAIEGNPNFEISDMEIKEEGFYTIDH